MPYRAQTDIDAANLALSSIGEPGIGSFSDNAARARAVVKWYGTILDELQREHDFGFNSAWYVPPLLPAQALGLYKFRFALPDDCLKVRRVLPLRSSATATTGTVITDPTQIAALEAASNQSGRFHDWDIEASAIAAEPPPAATVLVTNIAAPVVNYGRRIEIVRLWPADFLTAFVKQLGAAIAPTIAKDINAGAKLRAEANEEMDEAARTDGREQSPRHISRETSWVRSRYIGGGWRSNRPPS
jgi:hypothetical protein